jgi:hypothetical protein
MDMLSFLGYGKQFVSVVKTMFSNASVFVLVNGVLLDKIVLNNSIREGCPLTPYLYVLAANALGFLFNESRMQGWVRGISIPRAGRLEQSFCF